MTNYPENKVDWPVNSIVIHDADAKEFKMLMKVVEKQDGMIGTRYLHPDLMVPNCVIRQYRSLSAIPNRLTKRYREIYWNDKKYLHDPTKFGIEIPNVSP